MAEQTFKVGDKVTHLSEGRGVVEYGPFEHVYGPARYLLKDEAGKMFVGAGISLTLVPAFAVGDEVKYEYGGGGKLVAGPFKSGHHTEPIWVVEMPDGTHMTPTQNSMTKVEAPAPDSVKVGDRVRVTDDDGGAGNRFTGRVGVVASLDDGSELPYRVRFGDGRGYHGDANGTWNCKAVELVNEDAPAGDTFTHDGVTYELGADYRDTDGDTWTFARVGDEVRGEFGYGRRGYIDADSGTLAYAVRDFGPLTKI